jgi:hypothetical protein
LALARKRFGHGRGEPLRSHEVLVRTCASRQKDHELLIYDLTTKNACRCKTSAILKSASRKHLRFGQIRLMTGKE